MTNAERDVCEELGWRVREQDDGTVELESYSPAGENIIFYAQQERGFVYGVWELWRDFDANEHVELWADSRGKNGVPSTIAELLQDANDIKQMLLELYDQLAIINIVVNSEV